MRIVVIVALQVLVLMLAFIMGYNIVAKPGLVVLAIPIAVFSAALVTLAWDKGSIS